MCTNNIKYGAGCPPTLNNFSFSPLQERLLIAFPECPRHEQVSKLRNEAGNACRQPSPFHPFAFFHGARENQIFKDSECSNGSREERNERGKEQRGKKEKECGKERNQGRRELEEIEA
jgi:hypothetical protein